MGDTILVIFLCLYSTKNNLEYVEPPIIIIIIILLEEEEETIIAKDNYRHYIHYPPRSNPQKQQYGKLWRRICYSWRLFLRRRRTVMMTRLGPPIPSYSIRSMKRNNIQIQYRRCGWVYHPYSLLYLPRLHINLFRYS